MESERKSATLFTNCPYEDSHTIIPNMTPSLPMELEQSIEQKANPPMVLFADETSRGALNKATMPFWMARPPFGIPRFKDINTLRRLGNTPQARMAKQTIIDEIVTINWSILPVDEEDEIPEQLKNKIKEVETFFLNPNTNKEPLSYLLRQMLEDLLDLDSGIWVKEFDEKQRMVEIRAFDGATFLKNPNAFGKYDNRADIIPIGTIVLDGETERQFNEIGKIDSQRATNAALTFGSQPGITMGQARDSAAYFQYPFSGGFGLTANVRPIAFGKKEIVWFEKNPQTRQIYGKSPIESLENVLQTLKYAIEYDLDYFEDNNVPKGFIQLAGADTEEMEAFRDRWNELQRKTNSEGLVKKSFHRVPITNTENANFVNVQFSAAELQLIETQQWFSKLVWSMFGVTPSELGFTENSNLATEINQSRVFKRKAILPLLRIIEYYINNEIISEWDFHDEIKFEFNTFDVEDEKAKWELYKLQKEAGFKTANEIRKLEGLKELDELDEQMVQQVEMEKDEINPSDPNPEDSKKRAEKTTERKANEPSLDQVGTEINKILNLDKDLLLQELRRNQTGRMAQVKDFSSIINSINNLFSFTNLKAAIERATNFLFNKGIKNTENLVKQKNIQVNTVAQSPEKVEFLSDMVAENIKNISIDAKAKLKQQLKIGVANGEGIGQLSERVQKVIEVTKNRADMISRTESSRIEGQGQLHAAQQLSADGVNLKKYLLWTLDSRTSELTKALHSKYGTPEQAIPINQNFVLKNAKWNINQSTVPFHPNERDVLITLIVGE